MSDYNRLLSASIIHDMSEGVMTIGFDGVIQSVNPAATDIFGKTEKELIGQRFASAFFEYSENDAFNQTVLDAVYQKSLQKNLTSYYTGDQTRQLSVITSFFQEAGKPVGVIVVINDITEIVEMKARHEKETEDLLDSLVHAFAKAVDERSHYTANHTRNMVRMAEAKTSSV